VLRGGEGNLRSWTIRSVLSGLISPCHANLKRQRSLDRTNVLPRIFVALTAAVATRGRPPACPQRMRRSGLCSPPAHIGRLRPANGADEQADAVAAMRPSRNDPFGRAHRAHSAQRRATRRLRHLEKYDIRRSDPVGACRGSGRRYAGSSGGCRRILPLRRARACRVQSCANVPHASPEVPMCAGVRKRLRARIILSASIAFVESRGK
jgi:hypothetical protein